MPANNNRVQPGDKDTACGLLLLLLITWCYSPGLDSRPSWLMAGTYFYSSLLPLSWTYNALDDSDWILPLNWLVPSMISYTLSSSRILATRGFHLKVISSSITMISYLYLYCQALPLRLMQRCRAGAACPRVQWDGLSFFYVRLSFLRLHKYSIVPSAN